MKKHFISSAVLACALASSLTASQAQEALATRLAENISSATWAAYENVVNQLQQEGTGAAEDYTEKKGYVPTPRAFMRRTVLNVIREHKRSNDRRFAFTVPSADTPNFVVRIDEQGLSPEQHAEIAAMVADTTIRTARTEYTTRVAAKLSEDGHTGSVPLPAIFARSIMSPDGSKPAADEPVIAMRSLWNLNEQNALQDDFEREAWDFLVKQQEERIASGKPLTKLKWQPYSKVVTANGQRVFRYMSADPASAEACVACHNGFESQTDIKARRESQGVEAGKTFEPGELIGALSMSIPLQ